MAILDNDGNRILAKYYDDNIFPTLKEQKAFEKNLFNRTHRANAEIVMLDGLTCLYRSNVDLFFYVMGSSQENEVCGVFTFLIPRNKDINLIQTSNCGQSMDLLHSHYFLLANLIF